MSGMFGFSGGSRTEPPFPNPSDFKIEKVQEIGKYTVALIKYPGCTSFEGKKILVFRCNTERVRRMIEIDPHFDSKSPLVARLHPEDWDAAVAAVRAWVAAGV